MDRQRLTEPYMWSVIVIGAAVSAYSAYQFSLSPFDTRFLILAMITIGISSRLTTQIPHLSSHITVSDTFIFLTMMLYGGEAAILLAVAEGLFSSLRVNKKVITTLFNAAAMGVATFLTVWTLNLFFGRIEELPRNGYSATFIVAICVMALAQYVFNSGLVGALASLKINEPLWHTWRRHYLWTSITYFAGASAAGIIAILINAVGFYAVIVTTPIIAIIFFTYQTYIKNIEASATQAAQAGHHVEELSRYIAELKRAEEERDKLLLREQQARAEAESANRAKDEFLATLSHELRTPLTSILGWAGLLRTTTLNKPSQEQALETIERSAKTQAKLIDDLLDVSRIISGKLRLDAKQVNLTTVVEDAIDVVRPAADAKCISVLYQPELEAAPVLGDSARLQQVIWNLVSNAVKFTPEGGRVEVRVERVNSRVKVSVSDTGKGISPKFLPHVFDRFRQADSTSTRAHGGLGLGLAIVRHLVELHGGTAHAESQGEMHGATFSVALPLMTSQLRSAGSVARNDISPPKEFAPRNPPPEILEGLRVLVVDDQADTRRMIGAVIAQAGAEVKTCASTREALDALQRWKPDVLMSDIGMPDEDGYALIEKVRALAVESGGQIPAAALTAYAREEDRTRVLAAGYQKHVAKPIGSNELIATVANLAGRIV